MKIITFCFLLTGCSFCVQAQQDSYLNIDTSQLNVIITIDSVNAAGVKEKETSATAAIKAEYWDNTVYNSYKNVDVKFPLQLQFKDSTYHPPSTINKVITSRYGWRRGIAQKEIDIYLVTGDRLYIMFGGIVRISRYNRGQGKTVVIRHFNELKTVYAYLSKYGIKENDTITKGQYIGKDDTSGIARGRHLHLVVNYNGISINPEYLFDFNNQNTNRATELWIAKKWTRPVFHNSKRQSELELRISEEESTASLIKQKSIYVVKYRDTLSKISKRNYVSIAALCKTNTIR